MPPQRGILPQQPTKSKLDRVQNMGLRIILGVMRSTPIQQITNLQPLECRHEYKAAIKGEKLKRLTSHPFHQKLQHGTKKCLKRHSFKHKLKDLQKENTDLLEADPEKCEELKTSVSAIRGRAPQKPELKFKSLQQREHRPWNCRKRSHWRWCRIAIPRAHGPTSSQMALQRMLLGMEVVVLTAIAQVEPPPPSLSQLVTWAPTKEQKFTPWKLPLNTWLTKTANSRILSCSLTLCLLFSLSQIAPLTFAPSSYTTACVLCRTTTEYCSSGCHVSIARNETADKTKNNGYDPQKDLIKPLTRGPKQPSYVCVLVTVG